MKVTHGICRLLPFLMHCKLANGTKVNEGRKRQEDLNASTKILPLGPTF